MNCGRAGLSERCPLTFCAQLNIQQLDLSVKVAALDLQIVGGFRHVPIVLAELAADVLFFEGVSGIPKGIISAGRQCTRYGWQGDRRWQPAAYLHELNHV
jgi:hypothetical protein